MQFRSGRPFTFSMSVDSIGLLQGARFIPSPNFDERPAGASVDVLIVHCISLPPGQYGGEGIIELFSNRLDPSTHPYYREIAGLRVSSHLLVRRTGEVIQFVPFDKRAWHAGDSCCEGRPRVNDFSIGIELEGTDATPFETAQYAALAEATRAIMHRYRSITPRRIYGHSDIAPWRKTDPGPFFEWRRFMEQLA